MRIAIVSNGNAFSTLMLRPLFDEPGLELVGAVLVRVPPGERGAAGRLMRLARRTGLRYAVHKLGSLAIPKSIGALRRRAVFLDELCRARGVPSRSLPSINDASAIDLLRRWDPDVLVSVSSPERFVPEVLRVPHVASVNLHWALLPSYAGIAPYFWVLRNGEPATGLTIHLMVPELDAGDVLVQRRIEIEPRDTSLGLQLRLTESGAEELVAALRELPGSLESAAPQDRSGRSYFTWPTPDDVRELRRSGRKLARASDYLRLGRLLTRR